MAFDVKMLAIANLVVQLLLMLALLMAAYLVRIKRRFTTHCAILRFAVPLQVLTIAGAMLPSLLGYIEHGQRDPFFMMEILLHHTLGLAVVVLWIYINLVFVGAIKQWSRLVVAMRLALLSWGLALATGIHVYALVWLQSL